MDLVWLAIILIVFSLVWSFLKEQVNKNRPEPEEPEVFDIRFHGGPIDGHQEEVSKLKPSFFVPHVPQDEFDRNVVNIGGIEMIEPVYAKYEDVGTDGDYFFTADMSRTEMLSEVIKDNRDV